MTPIEFARQWYTVDQIEASIRRRCSALHPEGSRMPEDVYSREFAEWLTLQYQLAMAKGIKLEREGATK